jgi:autotransporter-associated beta strand protein
MQGIDTVNVRNNGAIIDSNNESVTINQVLQHSMIEGDAAIDGGLTKIGAGTLALSGANTYNGTTTVSNGTLLVNNATGSGTGLGSVIVTNATLGGIGFLNGAVTVYNSGTLAPGTNNVAGGVLTCSGGVTLAAGVTNAFDCTASDCDKVAVSGALTIQGANTVALILSGSSVPKAFTLFTFTSLTGEEYLGSWTVTGLPTWYVPRVRKSGNTLVVVSNAGTMVSFF